MCAKILANTQRAHNFFSVHSACTKKTKKGNISLNLQNKPFFPDPESNPDKKTGERSKFHTWAPLKTNVQYIEQSTVLIPEPLAV
jgi:hypothetical protein